MKQKRTIAAFLGVLTITVGLLSSCRDGIGEVSSYDGSASNPTSSIEPGDDSSNQTIPTEPSAPPETVIEISQDPVMPKAVKAEKLICHASNTMTKDEKIMMAVLQGYVSQSSTTQIYFADSHYATYLNYIKDDYGVTYTASRDIWDTVSQFKHLLNGYILYDGTGTESTNVANSLGGVLGCLIVTPALEEKAKEAGLTMKLDVRGKDIQWLFENYWDQLSHTLVVEIDPINGHELRDYAALGKAMVIYGNTPLHDTILKAMDDHARAIGYGDYSKGEQEFVNNYSDNGVYLVADGLSQNLSVFSGYTLEKTEPKNETEDIQADPNKHYVAFQVSDGDNVQVILNAMYTFPTLWKYSGRKNIKVSWGLPPTLIDLAPFSLQYYYENAGANSFACAASGMGYFYPSRMPLEELKYQAATLDYYLERTGMSLVQILDHNSYFDGYLWEEYTKQPNCDGVIYENYGVNEAIDGLVRFSNGEPVVAPRFTLWESGEKAAEEEEEISKYLQETAVRDPSRAAGYTLVFVNIWGDGIKSVSNVIRDLPADVEVVTPDEMFKLMKDNIEPVEWDIREGAEGWTLEGQVAFGAGRGLVFRADGGISDGQPKATASLDMKIPEGSEYMVFNFKAADNESGGSYRVRVIENGVESTLIEWARFTETQQGVCGNIKKLAGKEVTVIVDYDNGMSGQEEMLELAKVEVIGR